mmetsp:Transcript_41928/g.82198  ORF Transcript_41928/g.82198 Transcript_41928/m.82198 type:complete len:336 (+) Transcript_41928:109-1116(+)|eukprot:CAMPEP_0194324056 /NCGR_PEP_ID=MMETSP0171-20130528/26228_1 /TAXON_ID=218684 /ORGANISM="Corethron pennatum, Strain L29A3" /LENGTH=335 /DNA_ID=CAMNT_0039082849 /DNA_START=109 /DNA_END=1113 /DNA_ORIENTATION=-
MTQSKLIIVSATSILLGGVHQVVFFSANLSGNRPECEKVVQHVEGDNHNDVEVDYARAWDPNRENRMIFTHVGKSGGSYVGNLIGSLTNRNKFTLVNGALKPDPFNPDRLVGFNPSQEKLFAIHSAMPNNTVYKNHANYVPGFEDRDWISVVRDPLALFNSHFYYAVDTQIRNAKGFETLKTRKKDKLCGCYALEFDECIDTMYKNKCTIALKPQMQYFCVTNDPNCTVEVALSNAEKYVLVGITEEMALTTQMLEKLVPWVFRGQAKAVMTKQRSTHLFNPVTNTTLNGAISSRSRKQIKERAINYHEEMKFYDEVKKMFWRKAVELQLLNKAW